MEEQQPFSLTITMEALTDQWQRIVELTKQNMNETERAQFAKTSVRYIVRLLKEKIAKNEQEVGKIDELYALCQKIRHHDYRLKAAEQTTFSTFSEELIQRLAQ